MKKTPIQEKHIEYSLDELMSDRFGRYSKYIIQERALPDARDGLKPVQRRILYAMHEDGNTFEKPHRKSAKAVGYIIGYYHPHGDSSVYDAIVRLSQDWKMNVPLIDMQGNNGSIDDDPPAAMRYTEARLAKVCDTLLADIDKDAVEFTNNYDDSLLEPTVLPTRFPLLLVNGSTGIASGYATNIAPHNLNEVIDATIYRLSHPDSTIEELFEFVKGPDFPTGGIVQGKENLLNIFKTGKGKVVVRSKCEIVKGRLGNEIVIQEIPYEVTKSEMVKKIDEIRINKDIEGISDVRDESGRDGLKIVIELKKDADANLILNYLYKNTDLQINYNYNMIAIVNHRPTLMSLSDCLDAFIEHRQEVVIRRTKYLLDKKKDRLHIIEGLIKALSIIDDIIELIRMSKDKADAKKRLIEAFLFSEAQAEAIVSLRLYRLSNTDVKVLKDEYAELLKDINYLNTILSSKEVLISVISKELKEVKEIYGVPRRTVIEDEIEEINIDRISMIPNEACMVSVSKDGYIKRVSLRSYNASDAKLPGFKEKDVIIAYGEAETLDTLLLFTNKGNYAYIPLYEVEEAKWKDLGKHFSTYAKSEGEEKIVSALIVKDFNSYAFITTVSKNGLIKKTPLSDFKLQRYSKVVMAMNLAQDDELVKALITYEGEEVIVTTAHGYYNRYSLAVVSPTSLKSKGIIAISCKGDEVSGFITYDDDKDYLLLINNFNQMKRLKISDIPYTNRATKGKLLFKPLKTKKTLLSKVLKVRSLDDLLIYDEDTLTLSSKDIAIMGMDATFSEPLKLKDINFIINESDTLSKAKIVDFPKEDKEEVYEQLNIFDA